MLSAARSTRARPSRASSAVTTRGKKADDVVAGGHPEQMRGADRLQQFG